MLKIYYHNITRTTKDDLRKAGSILSPDEKERARKYRFEKDYKLYMAGKIMARTILGKYFNIRPDEVQFRVDEYSRPHLMYPGKKDFDLNISHSGEYVIAGISDRPIGVDIERIKPVGLDIAGVCFHDREIKYLFSDRKKIYENFFRLWTLKEAFIKAVGQGLSYPLKDFYFSMDNKGIKLNFVKSGLTDSWNFTDIHIDNNYKSAVCVNTNESLPCIIAEAYNLITP